MENNKGGNGQERRTWSLAPDIPLPKLNFFYLAWVYHRQEEINENLLFSISWGEDEMSRVKGNWGGGGGGGEFSVLS